MSPSIFSWQAAAAGIGGQQIGGAHTLNLRRDFFSSAEALQRQRATRVPAPARFEHRRGQRGLLQHLLHRVGAQKMEDVGQGKAVLLSQRDVQAVIGGGCLQLEIK